MSRELSNGLDARDGGLGCFGEGGGGGGDLDSFGGGCRGDLFGRGGDICGEGRGATMSASR